jgi:hypothetical protein
MSENSGVERPDALAIDSTQTLRAFTLSELHDPSQKRWFVVQLVVSDRPINIEMLPRLEVLAAYRLYSVAARRGAATCYGLRLGFFDREQSAQTICEQLKTFFRSPSVVRVSAAERARFEPPAESPTQMAAPSSGKVIDFGSARERLGRSVDQRGNHASAGGSATAGTPIASTADSPQTSTPARSPATQAQKATSPSHKVVKKTKSLAQELREEARQIELSKRGGGQQVRNPSTSWLARLLGLSKR